MDEQRWLKIYLQPDGRYCKSAMTAPLRDGCVLVEEHLDHGEAFNACELYNATRAQLRWSLDFYAFRLNSLEHEEEEFRSYIFRQLARCHWMLGQRA